MKRSEPTGPARSRRTPAVLPVILLPLLLMAACSDDDPTDPGGDPPAEIADPTTASQLVDNFFLAQAARDSAELASTFGAGFVFELDPAWVAAGGLVESTLILGETIEATGNLCGERLVVDDGQPRAPVTGIIVDSWEPVDSWTLVAKQEYGSIYRRIYETSMRITFAGASDMVIDGDVLFRAAEYTVESIPEDPVTLYDLVGVVDGTFPPGGDINDDCLSRLWRQYVGNSAPQAVISPESAAPGVGEAVLFSAAGTTDPEGNFPALPYRWRLSDGDAWSAWTDEPDTFAIYTEEGEYTVSLQARDRWGQTDTEFATVTVVPAYRPYTTADNVYLNYMDITANMDIDEYANAVDADFIFVETDLGTYGHDVELSIMDNIFAGRPGMYEGYPEAPVSAITFFLSPIDAWQPIPADDPYFGGASGQRQDFSLMAAFERPGSTRLEVSGQVRMYVKQIAGPGGTEFRVLGFLDYTSIVGRPTEEATWSLVKEIYR